MANEDARFVLPNACETKMVVTMNARSLNNFFAIRCCNRAQWEIRALAEEMYQLVYAVAPQPVCQSGPSCVATGRCPEGKMSCGKMKEVQAKYAAIHGEIKETGQGGQRPPSAGPETRSFYEHSDLRQNKCFDTKKAQRYFQERRVKFQFVDLPRFLVWGPGSWRTWPGRWGAWTPSSTSSTRMPRPLSYYAYDSQKLEALLDNPSSSAPPLSAMENRPPWAIAPMWKPGSNGIKSDIKLKCNIYLTK